MSNPQPVNNQRRSFVKLVSTIWRALITPHSSIRTVGEFRRAQLLSILTLVLSALPITCSPFSPRQHKMFSWPWAVSPWSHIFSAERNTTGWEPISLATHSRHSHILVFIKARQAPLKSHRHNRTCITYHFQHFAFTERLSKPCNPRNHSDFYGAFILQFTRYGR